MSGNTYNELAEYCRSRRNQKPASAAPPKIGKNDPRRITTAMIRETVASLRKNEAGKS